MIKNFLFDTYYKISDISLKKLFPLCRSLTGKGIKDTLTYFEKINPELKRLKFKSGSKVFDWTVPKEWKIKKT